MGSVAADRDSSEEPINVLITGFEPFKQDYPVNPSWEIARSLPTHLPPLRAKTTTTPSEVPPIPPVRLLVHPTPIRVAYPTVRALVPSLWHLDDDAPGNDDGTTPERQPKIDAAIHIGMAGPRLFYSIERRGHRDGYVMPDVDGGVPFAPPPKGEDGRGTGKGAVGGNGGEGEEGEEGEREGVDGEGKWVWEGLPEELETGFDVGDVLGRWRGYSPRHLDLRISEDAGHYLCDFIYFSSLAHLYKAGVERKVLFLHVPSDASEHSVAIGRELVLQLVRAVVESEMVRRRKAGKESTSSE